MYKFIGAITCIVIFTIYALTTSPYLQAGDSAEMATVAITLGVPHQPNYPLYTFLAHNFSQLPVSVLSDFNPLPNSSAEERDSPNRIKIYRTGLFSAFLQSLAVLFFYLVCIEIVKVRHQNEAIPISEQLLAALIALSYGLSATVWLYATKPEVFALNNLFATLLLYLTLNYWFSQNKTKFPFLIALIFGLAAGHHQTIVLLLPTLVMIHLYKQQDITGKAPANLLTNWAIASFDFKFNKLFPYLFLSALGLLPFFVLLWAISQRHPLVNWGEISNWFDLVRALVRSDYGIIGAYLTNVKNTTIVLDQIPFYASHVIRDLSGYLLVIAVIGYLTTFDNSKRLQKSMLIGFLISGPFFLMYANFSLDSDFSKATVIRFYMLSTIFIIVGAYLGLIWLNDKINQAKNTSHDNHDAITIAHGIFLSLVIALVINLGINNVPKYDNLTYHFAKTTIIQVEDNAIVMITGDIPTMTLQYMQAVEDQKKNRIIFSPGQFHLEWFQKQLRLRYPDLKIPEPYKGKMFTTVTQVVDANLEKHPIYVSPEFLDIDTELAKKYLLWPKGLLLKVERPKTEYKLEPYLDENTRLYASINLNDFAVLRSKSYQLESPLITFYARHFFNVGAILSRVHRYDDALLQFERSLSIDPSFSENYKSIANIFYLEKDYVKKDKTQALQYYAKYLETTTQISVEEFNAVSEVMKQINNELKQEQEKAENELKQAQEVEKVSATESAAIATESASSTQ